MSRIKLTTHEAADLLVTLARVLRSLPEGPLEEEMERARFRDKERKYAAYSDPSALVALVGFSKFTKGDWVAFIHEMDLPISLDPKHSSRDLMGKIVSYFADHPEGRARLRSMSRRGGKGEASQALLDAFSVLMRR